MTYELFRHVSQMEPLMPTSGGVELSDLVMDVHRLSGRLSGMLHPVTRRSIVELLRAMNSYYSNLIEGHRTNPVDIERALHRDFSIDQEQRQLQEESVAHIRVQRAIEVRLGEEDAVDLYSPDWIRWLHAEFYSHLPDAYRHLTDDDGEPYQVLPGQLRPEEVSVGRHIAPHHESVPAFLDRFSVFYGQIADATDRLIAVAASHHRLAWIHPFMDGNGRVVRLFSDALLAREQVSAGGLWVVSRGLARDANRYRALLAQADREREDDLDGRGRMSNRGLLAFCRFFLETALDQIRFMTSVLDLDGLEARIEKHLQLTGVMSRQTERANYLLREALHRGGFARGEAGRITNQPARTARGTLKGLTDAGLLVSDTVKGPVRLGFPVKVLEYYFPLLYPESTPTSDFTA